MSNLLTARKPRFLSVILASIVLPMGICLEAPFVIYGSNLEELLFSLADFLPVCLLVWLCSALAVAAFLFFVPDRVYKFAYPITVAVAFLLFVQGTYMNLGLNSLPGDNMAGETISTVSMAANTVIWISVIGVAVVSAFHKKRDIVRLVCILVSVVLIGTQLLNVVFVALTNDGIGLSREARMKAANSDYETRVLTCENLTSFAGSHNVIVFIVDRFDEDYAEKAYQETPEVYDELTGFTWYQDHIAMFGHTYPAITWMLTNTPYTSAVGRVEYQNTAFEGETPLKQLHDAGYTVNLYTQSYYSYEDEFYLPEYVANVVPRLSLPAVSWSYRTETAGKMMQLALYRCLPFAMKGILGNISSDINTRPPVEATLYSLDTKNVYQMVSGGEFTLQEDTDKSFSFIHVEGCHDVTYNENMEKPGEEEAGNYAVAVRASFRIIDRYLQEMKRLGVYDDATILITGDHSAPHHDGREVREPRLTALFVKPAGSGDEPLKRSSAQVSHEDFWATVFRSEGLTFDAAAYGTPVFEVSETETRKRIHRWQTYQSSGNLDEWIYEITGPGNVFSNWKEVSHEHYDKFLMD